MTKFINYKPFVRTHCQKKGKAEYSDSKKGLVPGVKVVAWEAFVSSLPLGSVKVTDKWGHCFVITKRRDNFITMIRGD